MITIIIDKGPIDSLQKYLSETSDVVLSKLDHVKEKGSVLVRHIKEIIDLNPAKSAYYASIGANLTTYAFGYFSFSSLAFQTIETISLSAHVRQAEKGKVSAEDKKLANMARANIFVNLFTSILDLPTVKLAGTFYNSFSSHIQVAVANDCADKQNHPLK